MKINLLKWKWKPPHSWNFQNPSDILAKKFDHFLSPPVAAWLISVD